MRRVVLNIQNNVFADAIAEALRGGADFEVYKAEKAEDIEDLCRTVSPYALLMEIGDRLPWTTDARVAVSREVKKKDPLCKTVLLVDENARGALAKQVRQAKKDGLIDQFFYGSISSAYLVALMDTL